MFTSRTGRVVTCAIAQPYGRLVHGHPVIARAQQRAGTQPNVIGTMG